MIIEIFELDGEKNMFVRWHGLERKPNIEWRPACDIYLFMFKLCDKQDKSVPEMLA